MKLKVRNGDFEAAELVPDAEEKRSSFLLDADMRFRLAEEARTERMKETREGRDQLMFERYRMFQGPQNRAFMKQLRYGKEAEAFMSEEEIRAQSVGSDAAGGYLAPAQFADKIFTAMKAQDRIQDESVVTVITTSPGTSFSIPMLDDTSASSAIVLENVGRALTPDLAFDQKVLGKADSWCTSVIKAPFELLDDAALDLEQILANAFAARLRRGIGPSFVTTLAAAAASGVTAGAAAIVPANLWDLFGSIDPDYLASQKCGWLMRLSTFLAISKLVDTAGGPIFPITRNPNGEFELLTKPVYFCPSVAAIGTTNKSVFFGALDYFVVRRVAGSVRILRHHETYAEVGQVGFNAFLRTNSGLCKPATADSPIKYLVHS